MERVIPLLLFLWCTAASAAPAGSPPVVCPGPAVLEVRWNELAAPGSAPEAVGGWLLPAAWDHPQQMTEGRVTAWVEPSLKSADGVALRVRFSYPTSQSLGLPFTFQGVELSWTAADGRRAVVLDYSEDCAQAGRAIFPRQAFESILELPTRGAWPLSEPRLRVWGSQN